MRELSDAEVFGSGELSDEEVFGKAPRKRTSQALGFVKGAMKPLDNAAMAMEAGARSLGVPTEKVNNLFAMPSAREARDTRAAAIEASPYRPGVVGEIGGNIVGTIPAMMATKNPFIAGAAQGALLTDSETPAGVALDAAGGAALNYFGGKVVDAAADAISPVIAPAVRRLKEAGVSLSPGMVKGGKAMVREDKMMSRPFVGATIAARRQATQETFNTASVNKILAPLGKKVPAGVKPGHDAIAYANDEIGRAYDLIVPNLSVRLNGQAFMQPVAAVAATLPKAQKAQVQQIASVTLRNGQLSGRALKDAQGELRRLASVYATDAAAPNRELGRVLSLMDDQLTREMIAQNPKWAPQLQKANEAYRGYRIVADAASRADDGLINTGQLKQSVRRGDRTKGKNATARGDAFMQDFSEDARSVIPARTPDTGTAGRLNEGNLFARLGGARDDLAFRGDELYQRFRLAPRPRGAERAAKGVKRLKGPLSAAAVAASGSDRD